MPDNNSSPSRFDSAVSASGLRSLGRRFSSIIILLVILGLLFAGLVLWRNIRLGGQQGWAQGPLPVTATVVEPREPWKVRLLGCAAHLDEEGEEGSGVGISGL